MALAVPEFQGALAELARRLGVDVEKLLAAVGRLSPVEQFAFITEAYPELVFPYLSASAELTAQWYDEQPSATSGFVAEPAELPPPEQLAANARWALLQDATVTLLQGAATRALFGQSRATVLDNVDRERGARWARHASANACGFCRMLATRHTGPNTTFYTSEEAATKVVGRYGKPRGAAKLGDKYHDHCHCVAVPVRPGQAYEPAPYVAQWERDYAQARKDGHADAASIAKAMDNAPTGNVTRGNAAKAAKAAKVKPSVTAASNPPTATTSAPVTKPAARTFASSSDGRKWAYKVWGGHRYTSEQFDAIYDYTDDGYSVINGALRATKGAAMNPRIADLDAAFDAAPRVPEDIVVTRQTTLDQFDRIGPIDPKELIGEDFTEHALLSTSVDASGVNVSGMADVSMTLTVPKGHKAIYVSGDEHGAHAISAVGGGESELILARGTKFRVTKSKFVGGRYIVEAEVI